MSVPLVRGHRLLDRIAAKLRRGAVRVFGGWLVRPPREPFDAAWYLHAYPDVAATGQNPLSHYILHGRADGRAPNEQAWRVRELAAEAFDATWYLQRYPDVAALGLDPLAHYFMHGRDEGRSPTLTHARATAWVRSFGEH